MRRVAVRVWELPVRCFHWVNVVSIAVLGLTGAYIHWPFLVSPRTGEPFLMGWARLLHLVAGWALAASLIGRFYWGFVGNRYARWREFFPFLTREGRRRMARVLRYYLLLEPRLPPHAGHNAVAATAYAGLFLVLLFQVFSGFALYAQYNPGGLAYQLFGWLFDLATNRWIRLGHYFVVWVVCAFVIVHVYAMWMSDLASRDGTSGSMFSGYKYLDAPEAPRGPGGGRAERPAARRSGSVKG